MRILRVSDEKELGHRGGEFLAAQVQLKPDSVLGLATGSTPIEAYRYLIKEYERGRLDFSKVTTVNLDEYKGLSPSDEQSYRYFMEKHLFSGINIRSENTHLPHGLAENSEVECKRYEQLIDRLGGINMQLLGIGHNGHIGFNEPAEEFFARTQCVALTESTIQANKRFFTSEQEVPAHAYTMGIGSIFRAKRIILMVSGADKATILKQALQGPIVPSVPASILQIHPNVTVIADNDALSELEV